MAAGERGAGHGRHRAAQRGLLGAILVALGACAQPRATVPDARYLELLQLASHLCQRGMVDPDACGRYRFRQVRDQLVACGALVEGELAVDGGDPAAARRHLAACLWLFDSLELGRLSLRLTGDARTGWRAVYWIRPEREAALRRHLAQGVAGDALSLEHAPR